MAIIVEDGTNVTGANSYVNVADCKAYLDLRGYTEWGFEVIQEESLLRAADYIERKYKLLWKGITTGSDQPLTFPRSGIIDENGRTLSSVVIPQELIDAQCLLANLTIVDGELVQLTTITTQDSLIKSKKEKVDVLEESVEYFQAVTQTFFAEVDDLLAPLYNNRFNGTLARS